MRTEERLDYIMKIAMRDGFVSIGDTANALTVSIETIRRDINKLCEENKLRKVRGGASPVKLPMRRSDDLGQRKNRSRPAHLAIGKTAAQLITDGKVVLLDSGAAVQAIAASVTNVRDVTFITGSVPIMSILLDKFAAEEITGRLVILGGEVSLQNRSAVYTATVDALKQYCADIAFLSCTAASNSGVYTYDLHESSYSKQMLQCTSYSVLVVESEKLGTNSVHRFGELTDFSHIISDTASRFPKDMLSTIEESHIALTLAD